MSAIRETEPGGEMVSIYDFEARPRSLDGKPLTGKRRAFSVGERVCYVSHFFEGKPADNPIGFMAIFKSTDRKDENLYGATQDYFVTLDCWDSLKRHFASNLVVTERDATKRPKKNSYILVESKDRAARGGPVRAGGGVEDDR